MKDQKGSVLAFVLVIAMVVMIICAGLARMVLMRSQATARVTNNQAGKKNDDGAVAQLMSAWSQSGSNQLCNSAAANLVGYTCTASACKCPASITGAPLNGSCSVTVCATCCTCEPTTACTCPNGGETAASTTGLGGSMASRSTACPPTVVVGNGISAGSCTVTAQTCD